MNHHRTLEEIWARPETRAEIQELHNLSKEYQIEYGGVYDRVNGEITYSGPYRGTANSIDLRPYLTENSIAHAHSQWGIGPVPGKPGVIYSLVPTPSDGLFAEAVGLPGFMVNTRGEIYGFRDRYN